MALAEGLGYISGGSHMSSAHHLQAGHRFWRRHASTTTSIFGAVVLAALGVVGGLDGLQQSGPPSRRIPVVAVDTSTTDANSASQAQSASADQQLLAALPAGYETSSCQPVTPPPFGALSAMDCSNNANGGPPIAHYLLFGDPQTLENVFATVTLNYVAHQTCPDGAASPGSWHFNVTPKQTAGSLVCGVTPNNSALGWTDQGVLLLTVAEGPSLDALYGWWQNPDPSNPDAGRAAFP
jgi:hypothetical protein